MFSLLQDVRFGLRMLAKHRLATLVSIVRAGAGDRSEHRDVQPGRSISASSPHRLKTPIASWRWSTRGPQQNIDMNGIGAGHFF